MTMTHELPGWVKDGLASLSVKRELPKWPVLTVVGQKVSPELGREICVRTTHASRLLPWAGNEDPWRALVATAYGLDGLDDGDWLSVEQEDALTEELGILPLEYLGNDRVTASRFEEPSGWCDWDGTIGTTGTYFDSKWPTLRTLSEELGLIAGTWPELVMTVQLSSYRDAEQPEKVEPFLTWDIEHGSAVLRRDHGPALRPVALPCTDPEKLTDQSERGCPVELLAQAVKETKEKIK
ncbi:hypothetical protein SEA_KRADAL_276 [Streptomyces phage Kradal]|nr:hypothetical protein SEA_KRADAL_276 [Streptomyces phage Kradal]QPL14584.1 hypothetical protein SEA_EHYELIMAYOE_279 [Streptomyces phage EhyElimayoE]